MPKPSLPEDLARIDRMLDLWAAGGSGVGPSTGGQHPLEVIRKMQDGAFIGGTPVPEPAEFKQIDDILREAPDSVSALLKAWYRRDTPITVKARRLGISRTTIYERWREALRYMQGAMKRRGVHCIA